MHEGRIAAGRGSTYDWVRATTYSEARGVVEALKAAKPILDRRGARLDCGLCNPQKLR
jgi:phage tail protein X